ncbi:CRISPR system precrRNA processing endoribonuclease RAMP protein Cas6 [Desulfococcaceae bacterium HSG8]|nr:CRISPR system precrRNA processing endoribonuclease RAMP protein Cas6 [Desulfococcaceae bacterium HSG8]
MRKVRFGMKKACGECPVRSECRYGNLYAYLFEAPWDHPYIAANAERSLNSRHEKQFPPPFVPDPPPGGSYSPGSRIRLCFTLVGKAIGYFPFMACAMSMMNLAKFGQGTLCLEGITDGFPADDGTETLIYDETGQIVGPGQVFDFPLVTEWVRRGEGADRICVRFLTPFRFKDNGRMGTELTFRIFMRNIFRRIAFLSVHSPLSCDIAFKELLDRADRAVVTEASDLRWYDWQRYSSRQNAKMKFGGLVGEVVFSGETDEFMPYIRLCEFLNVGKGVSFGLGKYEAVFLL